MADRIGRSQVRIALKHTEHRGTLIDVHTGDVDQHTVIAVHGFRRQPADLSPLIEQAIGAGITVKVFAYDDKSRSLEMPAAIWHRQSSNGGRHTTCSDTRPRSIARSSSGYAAGCTSSRVPRT